MFFSDVASVYLTRSRVRSELISMTNLAHKWLISKLESGEVPRVDGGEFGDANSLRVFALPTDGGASHSG